MYAKPSAPDLLIPLFAAAYLHDFSAIKESSHNILKTALPEAI